MEKGITFCACTSCPKASNCYRNLQNKNYPTQAGELVTVIGKCENYELFMEQK